MAYLCHFCYNALQEERFKDVVDQMEITGINKSIAKKALEDYLDDIINRLEDGIK